MTTKELAIFTGKDERTLRRWQNKASEKMKSISDKMSEAEKTKCPVNYTIDEVECILLSGTFSKDAVSILMQNARNNNLPITNVKQDNNLESMFIQFMKQQQETNKILLSMISNNIKQISEPIYIKPECYSLKAFMILKKISIPHKGQMILLGKELRKLSESKNKPLTKVPDEQYGEVNGYNIEVLEEFFKQD